MFRRPGALLLAAILFVSLVPTASAAPPTVTADDITTADGTYTTGDIDISVTFSEIVAVTTAGGTPSIALDTSPARSASYVSGSGTDTLVFRYAIQAGDTSADLGTATSPGTIILNGGTIKNLATEDAVLTMASDLKTANAVVIDAQPPTISSADITTADGAYKAGSILTITTTYSESVTVDTAGGTPSLALNFNSRLATYASGSGTATLSWTYTIQSGDTSGDVGASNTAAIDPNGGTIKDGAGNDATNTLPDDLTAGSAVVVDTTAPTVTVEQKTGQADPTNGDILYTITFSEPVTGFVAGDITLTGTATGASVTSLTGTGAAYEATITGITADGTVIASIPADVATDAAGNNNVASTSTDNTATFDSAGPTVTIDQKSGQADPTSGAILFTVVFSETVTDFATGDVTLTGTAGATTGTVTGSGTTYEVAASGMTSDGTVIASIAASVATDAAGNDNAASTSTDNSVTYETVKPTVTVEQKTGQADPTNGDILYTITFSEPVTGFVAGDITLTGTATGASVTSLTGTGAAYEATITGITADGTVIASIPADVATDAAGNNNVASTSTDNTVTFETVAPTVTVEQKTGQGDPTTASPILFTVVFSEAVTGFDGADITLAGTSSGGSATVTGSGAAYEISVSGMGAGTVVASIAAAAVTDLAGNANVASTSTDNTVTFQVSSGGGGGGGGGGGQASGSHGQSVGYNYGASYTSQTSHSVAISRGAVAKVDITLDEAATVQVAIDTQDKEATDLPAGYTSTKVWMDVTIHVSKPIDSATLTLRPLTLAALGGSSSDIVVMHQTTAGWVEVPTTTKVLSDGSIEIAFTASEFSPFVVAHGPPSAAPSTPPSTPPATPPPAPDRPPSALPDGGFPPPEPEPEADTPGAGLVATLCVVAAALLMRRRS